MADKKPTPSATPTKAPTKALIKAPTKAPKKKQKPIELYYWPTPNGWKVSIMLEECGLPYTLKPVNIGMGDQFKRGFLKIAPNNCSLYKAVAYQNI